MARTGVRLPLGPTDPNTTSVGDPANGERVLRCQSCGMPDRPGDRLLEFQLLYRGRHAGRWVLCESDYLRGNPPPTGIDPLDVTDAA